MAETENAAVGEHPWWLQAIVVSILVVVFLYVVLVVADPEVRARFEGASQALGLLATLGTVATLVMLIRQVDLQRVSLDEQRHALEEQRLTLQLARFESLRVAYAEYLGAAAELLAVFVDLAELAPRPESWELQLKGHRPLLEAKRTNLTKAAFRLGLQDRSAERERIREHVTKSLGHAHNLMQAFEDARDAAVELRRTAVQREPEGSTDLGRVDEFTEEWLQYLTNDQRRRVDGDALKRVQMVSVRFAQLALRASLSADEAEVARASAVTPTTMN